MSEKTILDLDALMDMKMGDIETLPNYVNPPAGNYELSVFKAATEKYEGKPAKGDKAATTGGTRIRVTYAIDGILELSNKSELPPAIGDMFSETFMGTEEGVKYFKKQVMNVLNISEEEISGASIRDMLDGLMGTTFRAAVTVQKTEGGFENARIRAVHSGS